MLAVRRAPIFGLIFQTALLVTLAASTGLGVAGWIAGAVHGLVLCTLLINAGSFGPADWVTMTRAVLGGGVTALVADAVIQPASLARPVSLATLVGLAVVALALDAVDGQVARRTGTASVFGARFDMETDAFLILVLSVYSAPTWGAWVLAIGLMRYAYVAAGWMMPWLRGSVPPRYWRKVVAAIQGIVLVYAAAAMPGARVALLAALALLAESFGRDVVWLWARHRASVNIPGSAQRPEPVEQAL